MSFGNYKKFYSGDVPPKSTTAVYCGAGAFRDACYQLVSSFLLTYMALAGLLSHDPAEYLAQFSVISLIVIIYRIWDGINDPIMGWIIEKVHFKSGNKYKPWILIGGILNTIVVLVLFLWRPTGWGFVAMFAVFYFLWDIVFTINDIAYWSMLPSLTSDEKKRNSITTIMQICISIGVFAVYGAVPMLVGDAKGNSAQDIYGTIAIIVCTLFLLSQVAIAVLCKEHERDPELEAKERNDVRFKDMITLFKVNDQFRVNIVSILLNYLGGGVVVAFAMYYFYLMFGYGSELGGSIQFLFTIMYAVGTLVSQFLYPFLAKKMSRKAIFIFAGIVIAVGYTMLYFVGFPVFGPRPIADIGTATLPLLYVGGFIIFFGQGIVAVAILIQMQATIEYNEWKFGDRKEAIVSAMRALVAKWGSAIQQGLVYATLAISGLYAISQTISNGESQLSAGLVTVEEMRSTIEAARATITTGQFNLFALGMIWIPLIIMLTSVFLCAFVFKIDEKKYSLMVEEIKARNNK